MENMQQPTDYYGGHMGSPYPGHRPPYTAEGPAPSQSDHAPPQWASPQGYDCSPYRYRCDHPPPPMEGGFGGPRFPPPFGFDPTVPPPSFGYPPPLPAGPFPGVVPPSPQQFRPAPHAPQGSGYDLDSSSPVINQQFRPAPLGAHYDLDRGHDKDQNPGTLRRAEDESSLQRSQDQQWIRHFLQSRCKTSRGSQDQQQQQQRCTPDRRLLGIPDLRRTLYRAAQLVSQLAQTCESLRGGVQEDSTWTQSYSVALKLRQELQDSLSVLSDGQSLAGWKVKLSQVAKRRSRRLRSQRLLRIEENLREERWAEKEAAIDKWRLQQIQRVEEKKKEQEVKLAADSVLCEVRRKQADVKRIQDVLRSVEKLRKLRKEAASRKGIVTEPDCDEAFRERVEQLRSVMKKRTVLYSAEEKALRVMLEGEQEEERRREQERKVKKERERQLQRRRRVQAVLFGEDPPAHAVLQPFTQFYTQAEGSLLALLQIRREWDVFVVDADHPDGSPVPQTWILPDPPSDQVWASALQTEDPNTPTASM